MVSSRLTSERQERGTPMTIPTEPIGSIPRPQQVLEAVAAMVGTDLAAKHLGIG